MMVCVPSVGYPSHHRHAGEDKLVVVRAVQKLSSDNCLPYTDIKVFRNRAEMAQIVVF